MSDITFDILEYRRLDSGDFYAKVRTTLGEFAASAPTPDRALQAALSEHVRQADALSRAERAQDMLDHPIVVNV